MFRFVIFVENMFPRSPSRPFLAHPEGMDHPQKTSHDFFGRLDFHVWGFFHQKNASESVSSR